MLIDRPPLLEYVFGDCIVTCLVTGAEWRQNAYIVSHRPSRNAVLIDPGDDADLIIKQVQERGETVSRILLTHPHHDHIGAAAQVSAHFKVACELHKQDIRLLMHAPMYALRFANRRILPVPDYQAFETLSVRDGEPVVRSIHTPGHTKGSVCYLFDGFVMTGDTLLCKHVGRTDLPGASAEQIVTSIDLLLSELAGDAVIFSGHGKPWAAGEAKQWWREMAAMPPVHKHFSEEMI
jgi:glyoxylase-like metal-dependent hydrolase (beta-lactamase superfamily II)